jgi:carboxymethylenebutenolidase
MCHDAEAIPPLSGSAGSAGEQILLTSADGTRLPAHLATPNRASGVGVLVLPDNRGLSGFYEELTCRVADAGHVAIAIDYYSRSAGTDYRSRVLAFNEMANVMPHLMQLRKETLNADFIAALDHLRSPAGGRCRTLVALGFCVGGRFASLFSAPRFGLDGVISFYGAPDELNGVPGPIQLAAELSGPILGIFGGADEGIPQATVRTYDEALTGARVEHEFVTYPGAPHGFFDAGLAGFEDAKADAWGRVVSFLDDRRPVTLSPAG